MKKGDYPEKDRERDTQLFKDRRLIMEKTVLKEYFSEMKCFYQKLKIIQREKINHGKDFTKRISIKDKMIRNRR